MNKPRTQPHHLFNRHPPHPGTLPNHRTDTSAYRARLTMDAFAARTDKTCLVCGSSDAPVVGCWEPGDEASRRRLGTPAGKARFAVYALCCACYEHTTAEQLTHHAMRMVDVLLQTPGVN